MPPPPLYVDGLADGLVAFVSLKLLPASVLAVSETVALKLKIPPPPFSVTVRGEKPCCAPSTASLSRTSVRVSLRGPPMT